MVNTLLIHTVMDMEFLKNKAVRKKIYLAVFVLFLAVFLAPQHVVVGDAAPFYPQSEAKLNPRMIAMVPIPLRKPEASVLEKARYGVFKGFRNLIGLDEIQSYDAAHGNGQKLASDVYGAADVKHQRFGPKLSGLVSSVREKLRAGEPVKALTFFRNAAARKAMTLAQHDDVQSRIAAGFLYSGRVQSAGRLAGQSAERSGAEVPMAGWIAGLAYWQMEDYRTAAKYFEVASKAPDASGWMSAAASFWASRSYEKAGNPRGMMVALKRAAEHPRTFYGLMAVQALGRKFDFNWSAPVFDTEKEAVLASVEQGSRAIQLASQGMKSKAESELLSVADTQDPVMREALLAFAAKENLPKLSMRLGHKALVTDGEFYDAALYPVSPWEPDEGFTVDPALVHAVMRQESKFDVNALSDRGATGLMQILPSTARYVSRGAAVDLKSPRVNVQVGQDYLKYLLKDKNVDGDIINLLVAYNAGPGNLAKWKSQMNSVNDPLLFIEMIPVAETREYVERVMASYWMYRLRDGKDLPSLRAMSRGEPARYAGIEAEYDYAMLSR